MSRIDIAVQLPENVVRAHTQRHRKYHDIHHILYMSNIALNKDLFPTMPLKDIEVQMLLWDIFYHDYVYNIPDPDKQNEELSAQQFLIDHADFEYKEIVADHIRATKTHIINPNSSDKVLKCLIDLDLWALADDRLFGTNNELIKQEVNATDEQWLRGRSTWIENFLQRDQIFYTPEGTKREKRARENLERDLRELRRQIRSLEHGREQATK